MARIHIEVDDSEVRNELNRLIEGPKEVTIGEFEAMLIAATAMTEAAVHIETGSLKSTVHPDSSFEPLRWQGAVRAGGAAPGMPRDPAFYGVYELARGHQNGRNHHFYAELHDYVPRETIDIILKFFAAGQKNKAAHAAFKAVKP